MTEGRPPRVLVIDDDPSVRQVVRFCLRRWGMSRTLPPMAPAAWSS